MRHLYAGIIGMALIMVSCATPPKVVQGTVVSCNESAKIIAIQDQDKPGSTLEFRFGGAEVGANPQPGDIVRIAYRVQNDTRLATRIMNISRQKDIKTGK
jgi:starvation-inducible outer membrane lipoprotein